MKPTKTKARQIVELAAELTTLDSVKRWLLADERGVFETRAKNMLKLVSEDEYEDVARYLAVAAIDAMIKQQS